MMENDELISSSICAPGFPGNIVHFCDGDYSKLGETEFEWNPIEEITLGEDVDLLEWLEENQKHLMGWHFNKTLIITGLYKYGIYDCTYAIVKVDGKGVNIVRAYPAYIKYPNSTMYMLQISKNGTNNRLRITQDSDDIPAAIPMKEIIGADVFSIIGDDWEELSIDVPTSARIFNLGTCSSGNKVFNVRLTKSTDNTIYRSSIFFNNITGSQSDLECLKDWDVSEATLLEGTLPLFTSCSGITSLDMVKDWKTSKLITLAGICKECVGLINMEGVSQWDVSSLTRVQVLFNNCPELERIDLSNWNVNLTYGTQIMNEKNKHPETKLKYVDIQGFGFSESSGMNFSGYDNIETFRIGERFFGWKPRSANEKFTAFQDLSKWTHDSMIESLYTNQLERDKSTSHTIVLHPDAFAKLSEEEVAKIGELGLTLVAKA